MHPSADEIAAHFAASLARARRFEAPFRHFVAEDLFPAAVAEALAGLPVAPSDPDGLSGKRDYRNDTRCFFDAPTMQRFPIAAAVAGALQSRLVVDAVVDLCGAALAESFLRIEYAVDIDGFWLEPHTDLSVKKLTLLIFLAHSSYQSHLGTDLYSEDKQLHKTVPFLLNSGLLFVPGENTWHGFSKRPIRGERKSLIVNYVGSDWRDREQLAFSAVPVR